MRILNLLWKFSTGGIGKCFLTYATLHDVDSTVDVVSVCIDPQNFDYDRKALHQIGAIIIPIKNIFDPSWIPKAKKIIYETNPDVIFCHGFNGPIVVQIIKLIYRINIPMVCSYHGLYHAPTRKKKLLAPIYNSIQIHLYKHYAKKVILVENHSKEYLIKSGIKKEKTEIVHNGIPDSHTIRQQIQLTPNTISIGLASRLDAIKGIDYLLNAVPYILKNTQKQFHIYILGDGPLLQDLLELCNILNITEYVSFLGYQSNVSDWLQVWDIFCLPSLSECHSIALLEAMRASKAIVATNVGGNEESVTNMREAIIVPSKNSEHLADALVKLINSESLRETLGNNAKERFKKEFTEEVMKRNLIKVLSTV